MSQSIEFWPLKLLSEVLRVHQDSISQSGSCLGSVSVHSLTLPHTFSHSREYVMWLPGSLLVRPLAASLPWLSGFLPFGPQPCNPFALVASPKLGLRQNWQVEFHVHTYTSLLNVGAMLSQNVTGKSDQLTHS
jgi:hypothetical protein